MSERPNSYPEDVALVRRAAGGHEDARAAVVARIDRVFSTRMARLGARAPILRGHEDDLRQRFSVRMLDNDCRDLNTYAGHAPLDGWLAVVVSRWLLREAGALARRREQPLDDDVEVSSPADSPEDVAVRSSDAEAVRRAIGELSPRDRTLLALLFEQDVPAHAAGQALGLTSSGVRMRKSRLLATLRKRLRHLGPEDPT